PRSSLATRLPRPLSPRRLNHLSRGRCVWYKRFVEHRVAHFAEAVCVRPFALAQVSQKLHVDAGTAQFEFVEAFGVRVVGKFLRLSEPQHAQNRFVDPMIEPIDRFKQMSLLHRNFPFVSNLYWPVFFRLLLSRSQTGLFPREFVVAGL